MSDRYFRPIIHDLRAYQTLVITMEKILIIHYYTFIVLPGLIVHGISTVP